MLSKSRPVVIIERQRKRPGRPHGLLGVFEGDGRHDMFGDGRHDLIRNVDQYEPIMIVDEQQHEAMIF